MDGSYISHEPSTEIPPLKPPKHGPTFNEKLNKNLQMRIEADLQEDHIPGGGIPPTPNQPAPVPAGQSPLTPPVPQPAVPPSGGPISIPVNDVPSAADDSDLIEKEWVSKAKYIVESTKEDPHLLNQEINKFKADYIQKRYNKQLKVSEE